MSSECAVLIAAPDLLGRLKQRVAESADPLELLTFNDADALRALEAITKRRPAVIALERHFAATPRGSALVNRIKADPALVSCAIHIVSPDADQVRIAPRRPAHEPAHEPAHGGGAATATAAAAGVAAPAQLDFNGTRRAQRYKVAAPVDVLVDGNAATLVDVSTVGAQVVTPVVLKPNQRIRVALPEDGGSIRFNAAVAWAKFEIPPNSGPRYRAGIEFLDANASAVDAYCARHKS